MPVGTTVWALASRNYQVSYVFLLYDSLTKNDVNFSTLFF